MAVADPTITSDADSTIRVAVAVLTRGHQQLSGYSNLIERNRALALALNQAARSAMELRNL